MHLGAWDDGRRMPIADTVVVMVVFMPVGVAVALVSTGHNRHGFQVPGGAEIVLMEMEHAQQQQHHHQTNHQPPGSGVRGPGVIQHHDTVGKQMIEGDPQHQTGNKTHGHLSPRMRHPDPRRQPAAKHGKPGDGQAITYQEQFGSQCHDSGIPRSSGQFET